jgi:hypothetical protein
VAATLTPQAVLAWANAASVLIAAGVATVAQIRQLIAGVHADIPAADLDRAIEAILADATRRARLAEADAAGR